MYLLLVELLFLRWFTPVPILYLYATVSSGKKYNCQSQVHKQKIMI